MGISRKQQHVLSFSIGWHRALHVAGAVDPQELQPQGRHLLPWGHPLRAALSLRDADGEDRVAPVASDFEFPAKFSGNGRVEAGAGDGVARSGLAAGRFRHFEVGLHGVGAFQERQRKVLAKCLSHTWFN